MYIIPTAKSSLVNHCSFDLKLLTHSLEVCKVGSQTAKLLSAFILYCASVFVISGYVKHGILQHKMKKAGASLYVLALSKGIIMT